MSDPTQVYAKLRAMGVFSGSSDGKPSSDKPKADTSERTKINIPSPMRDEAKDAEAKERHEKRRIAAEANQKYYLDRAAKDGKAWHLHTKSQEQYSEFVVISVLMSKIIIDNYNFDNRRIKKQTISSYSRDMSSGRWIDTGESIQFDINGNCINGQHRLISIIESGVPQRLYVTFNCDEEAKFGIDQGVVRSATEKINLVMENHIGDKLPAVARAMMRGISRVGVKFSQTEITTFCLDYGDVIEWAVKSCKGVRADVQAVLAKAALWHGKEVVLPFCEQISNLDFNNVNDPAKKLYEFLHKSRSRGGSVDQLTTYKKALSAFEAFLKGRTIGNLQSRDVDIFEWVGTNWKIPEKK